ncbi:MAG TPA: helix-turn-helix domain-containing protein [Gemmatimonadales bacterium]|jgi:DNA-binding transcriptional ArsR family regulator
MKLASPLSVIDDPRRASLALDPIRLRLLQELAQPDSAVGLARRLGLPRQKINYHLRLLEEQGLVELVEERRRRNCTERVVRAVAHSYLINPAALGALAADPSRVSDRTSSTYLIATAAQVIRDVASLRDQADTAGKKLPTLTLQVDIRFASPADQQAFAQELSEDVARLTAKYHDDQAAGGRRFRFISGAYPAPAQEEQS